MSFQKLPKKHDKKGLDNLQTEKIDFVMKYNKSSTTNVEKIKNSDD